VLVGAGFRICARLNLRKMLESAPELAPPVVPLWERFPGFDGFTEQAILADPDVIFDRIYSGEDDPAAAEVNALDKHWAEIGVYLIKR
jgi:hypothetical protein